jgi:hypothetical protein
MEPNLPPFLVSPVARRNRPECAIGPASVSPNAHMARWHQAAAAAADVPNAHFGHVRVSPDAHSGQLVSWG